MTQIKKITDKQGNDIYLRTHTKAVVDDNGYTAESRLQAMQDEINQAQLEVGAVPSDLIPTEGSTNWVTSGGVFNATNINDANVEIDLSEYTAVRAFPNPNIWLVTNDNYPYYGMFIPIEPKQKYRIKANANYASVYCFLTTNTYSQNASVSYATGCTRVSMLANTETIDTAPSNARYLYVATYTTVDVTPQKVEAYNKKSFIDAIQNLNDSKLDIPVFTSFKNENERNMGKTKYYLTDYQETWQSSNNNISAAMVEGDLVITITRAGGRVGFNIESVNVGESLLIDFEKLTEPSKGIVFGYGKSFSDPYKHLINAYESFTFTKTSTDQKYIYIPGSSYTANSTITVKDFTVYLAIGPKELSGKVSKLEKYAFMPSSYIPIMERYEKYMDLSSTSYAQGSAIYGDYFIQGYGYQNAAIRIYDLESKTLVQEVTLPTFANPRYHNNTISFSGTKYDSGDDFPLLYMCSGYTDTTSDSATEVYVVRIVGASGSYTTELIQTIYLDFGITNSWTEWVCDPVNNRAWINGTGIAKYICVSIPDTTNEEVTIDANTTIIDSFTTKAFTLGTTTWSSGQCRFFYHNRVYWVSGIPSEGLDALYVCVDNTLTHCTEAVVSLKNFGLTGEPEGCFIWKDEFYVAYRGFIVKLIQN